MAILNKQKLSFFQNRERESKTGPVWGLVPVGRGRIKGCRRVNMVEMYENGKMRPVETIPGMERRDEENDGGGEFNYDIF
jgi:hypothetical protein